MASPEEVGKVQSNGSGTGSTSGLTNANGWDGKLRVDKKAVITNPEALSDPEYSDEDAPPVEEIAADEGNQYPRLLCSKRLTCSLADLLEDYEKYTDVRLDERYFFCQKLMLCRTLIWYIVESHLYLL